MSQQEEGKFKKRVVEDLRADWGKDIMVTVTQERARKGVSDLLICLKGFSIRDELKLDGEVPTRLQQLKLDEHSRAGGISLASTPSTWPMHRQMLKERFK